MPLSLPDNLARRIPPRQRRWAVGAGAVLAATALLAMVVPVSAPDTAIRDRDTGNDTTTAAIAPEDLTAFLDTKRWGRSLREIQAERDAAARAETDGLNPVLVEMGYVGLIVTTDHSAMLLRLPEGDVARLTLGDNTPDGRTLSSITENTLTLTGEDGSEEVLELFPGRPAEADADGAA